MATVETRGVYKKFGAVEVIHCVDIPIAHGEFVILAGPSGCARV